MRERRNSAAKATLKLGDTLAAEHRRRSNASTVLLLVDIRPGRPLFDQSVVDAQGNVTEPTDLLTDRTRLTVAHGVACIQATGTSRRAFLDKRRGVQSAVPLRVGRVLASPPGA